MDGLWLLVCYMAELSSCVQHGITRKGHNIYSLALFQKRVLTIALGELIYGFPPEPLNISHFTSLLMVVLHLQMSFPLFSEVYTP